MNPEKELSEIHEKVCFGDAVKTVPLDELIKICIYFLIDKCEVVYVGQSVNIYQRLNSHRNDVKKDYDEVKLIEYRKEELNNAEDKIISLFEPKYNKTKTGGFFGIFDDLVHTIKIKNKKEIDRFNKPRKIKL